MPGSGVIMIAPVSVCHHVSTTGCLASSDELLVPDPGFGIDRLPDAAEQTQRREIVLRRVVRAPLHERADRGRSRVQDRHAVLLDDRPPPVLVGPVRRALVEDRGAAVGEGAVDDVAVARDPTDVRRAPVDVGLRLDVEDVLVRRADAGQVSAGRVHDPFRLTGRSRGVEDVEHVLRVHRFGSAIGRASARRVARRSTSRPSSIVHVLIRAPDHDHLLDRRACARALRPRFPSAARLARAGNHRRR